MTIDASAVLARMQAECDEGAAFDISKTLHPVACYVVTYTGGTQLVGGSMSAGDTLVEALATALDMDMGAGTR